MHNFSCLSLLQGNDWASYSQFSQLLELHLSMALWSFLKDKQTHEVVLSQRNACFSCFFFHQISTAGVESAAVKGEQFLDWGTPSSHQVEKGNNICINICKHSFIQLFSQTHRFVTLDKYSIYIFIGEKKLFFFQCSVVPHVIASDSPVKLIFVVF